jgi:hypothetical protein
MRFLDPAQYVLNPPGKIVIALFCHSCFFQEARRQSSDSGKVCGQRTDGPATYSTVHPEVHGAFNLLPSSAQWKTPAFKLLVFSSSTFTDTQLERDFLMDELLFTLRSSAELLLTASR